MSGLDAWALLRITSLGIMSHVLPVLVDELTATSRPAVLSLRDRGDATEFVRTFAGTDRLIVDFLRAEVLAGHPKDAWRFLWGAQRSCLDCAAGYVTG